ncbi:hypothetical protein ACTFIW_007745 [Dictyostelium discoideum]
MDVSKRYSIISNRKSFIEDGFTVTITLKGIVQKVSFQSSVTVDHVKFEILKQFYPSSEQSYEYFLAINKTEILQIEFVRFIFAHEAIQKSLLIKKSIEVYLIPKSKEIIARKCKADIIKKQLGTYVGVKQIPSPTLNSKPPPSVPPRRTNSQTNIQKVLANSNNNNNNINNNNNTTTTTTTSNNNVSASPSSASITSTAGVTISKSTSTSSLVLVSPTTTTTTNKTAASPSSSSISQDGSSLTFSQEDVSTEILKLQLQQQLMLLEDEELTYQSLLVSTESDDEGDTNNLLGIGSGGGKTAVELDSIFSLSPQSATSPPLSPPSPNPTRTKPAVPPRSFNSLDESETLTFKKEPILPKSSNESLLGSVPNEQKNDKSPLKSTEPTISTVQQPIVEQQQQQQLLQQQQQQQQQEEVIESQHWSNYLSMKPLKPTLNEIPIQVQVKDNYFIMGCNKNFTSSEFKSYLVSNLESMIQAIKVGTFATNDISSETIAFKKNAVICDLFTDSIQQRPTSIPSLIVLKPGMQDLFKGNSRAFIGSPIVNSNNNSVNNNSINNSNSSINNSLDGFKLSTSLQTPSVNLSLLHNNIQNLISNNGNSGPSSINSNSSSGSNNGNITNYSSSIGNEYKQPISGSLIFSNNKTLGRNANFSLGEQRDNNAKLRQQKKKLTAIQISSLLGEPLNWSNTENEIKYFRNLAEQIFDFQTLDERDRVKITIAPVTNAHPDPLLPSTFRVRFYLPPDNHSTTINVMSSDTVTNLIEKVIAKHNNSTKLISSDHTPSDYVIRITGTSDHVLKTDELVTNLIVVRNRLQRKKDIKFSLVHKTSLPKIYIDGHSPEICTLKNNNNNNNNNINNNNNNNINNNNNSENGNIQQPYGSPVNILQFPISPRSENNVNSNNNNNYNNYNNYNNNNNSNRGNNSNRSILLYEINRPFEIRIICLENLVLPLFQKYLGSESNNFNDVKLTIMVELCHGEDVLTEPMETVIKLGSNPLWCEWLRSALLMSNIPRASKLCFTAYAQQGDKQQAKVSIGWADLQLIDYHSQLLSGVISLILWPGARTDIPDFNVPSPSLVIEFCQFPFPVVFPKPEMMERTEIRDYVESRKEDTERLEELTRKDSLYVLTETDKKFIWLYRMHLQKIPSSLPKVLQSLNWNNPQEVKEAHRLLSIWSTLSPLEALELLDSKFADELVREYAVNCLHSLADSELALYLLQLVQSLKHEPYHNSALCRFLIRRALNNRAVIGHPFFWHLEAEMHNPKISERYSLVLETFLKGCGNQRHEFVKQMEVVTKLQTIAKLVKEASPNKRKNLLHEELNKMSWPNTFHLPISPSTETCGVIVSECRWLDSFTVPLYLVFQNVDPVGEPIAVIFKNGDDLRQDILTLQMISVMDNIWKQNGLDLHLSIYNVTAINEDTGFIEVVPDSDTTANIQKAAGGVTAAFTKTPLSNWLRERNQSDPDYEYAVGNFTHSLAGYCVATFILGISDRHNDNIMVSKSGHLFHIDFAHFLGNIMKFHGYKREKAPFVLTPEFAHVMGGEKSLSFKFFSDLCCLSYKFLRNHRNLFINLFSLMISTGIPELSTKADISYLKEAFLLDVSDEEAGASFERLIQKSLKTKTTQVMFAMHILAHSGTSSDD